MLLHLNHLMRLHRELTQMRSETKKLIAAKQKEEKNICLAIADFEIEMAKHLPENNFIKQLDI